MTTQVIAYPQAQLVSLEAFRQLSTISDNVSMNLSLGQILPVHVDTSIFPLGSQVLEELKARIELITNFHFDLRTEHTGDTALWPILESMSSGLPANSVDTAVDLTAEEQSISASTPSANDVASTQKKIPRPKNAFMIYRLQYHSKVAGANPGMHNNDISKKIGLQWRSEKPEVIEAFKRQAEDEKRQHAIAHPGYRYQPRKPSEKKKRMTKTKLAKLAANSGSSNTTMDLTSVPAQLHPNQQFYEPSAEELANFNTMPWDFASLSGAAGFGDINYDISSRLAGTWPNTSPEQSANPTTTHQPVAEQHRQDELDNAFAMNDLVDFEKMETANGFVLGDECVPVAPDFDPFEAIAPVEGTYSFCDGL